MSEPTDSNHGFVASNFVGDLSCHACSVRPVSVAAIRASRARLPRVVAQEAETNGERRRVTKAHSEFSVRPKRRSLFCMPTSAVYGQATQPRVFAKRTQFA